MDTHTFGVRPYRHSDLEQLYMICLRTAASGEDGSHLYARAPGSVGDYYAAPYADHSPGLCFVLDDGSGAKGYVLGVADTAGFDDWLEDHWFPLMRERYPWPEGSPTDDTAAERLIRRFHQPVVREAASLLAVYPAHLHIDLLPEAQGQGNGRRLMETFVSALRARGVRGIHLGLGVRNSRAQRFYERLGFQLLQERGDPPHSLLMGLALEN